MGAITGALGAVSAAENLQHDDAYHIAHGAYDLSKLGLEHARYWAYREALAKGLSEEEAKKYAIEHAKIGPLSAKVLPFIGIGLNVWDIAEHGANPLNMGGLAAGIGALAGMGAASTLFLVPGIAWAIHKLGKGSTFMHIKDLEIVDSMLRPDGKLIMVARVNNNPDVEGNNDIGPPEYLLAYDIKENKLYKDRASGFEGTFRLQDGKVYYKPPPEYEGFSGEVYESPEIERRRDNLEEFKLREGTRVYAPASLQAGIYNELVKYGLIQGKPVDVSAFKLKEHSVKAQHLNEAKMTNFWKPEVVQRYYSNEPLPEEMSTQAQGSPESSLSTQETQESPPSLQNNSNPSAGPTPQPGMETTFTTEETMKDNPYMKRLEELDALLNSLAQEYARVRGEGIPTAGVGSGRIVSLPGLEAQQKELERLGGLYSTAGEAKDNLLRSLLGAQTQENVASIYAQGNRDVARERAEFEKWAKEKDLDEKEKAAAWGFVLKFGLGVLDKYGDKILDTIKDWGSDAWNSIFSSSSNDLGLIDYSADSVFNTLDTSGSAWEDFYGI